MSVRHSTVARWAVGTAGGAALAAGAIVGLAQAPATAAPVPEVFAGFDDVAFLSGTTPRTNTVRVPPGAYAITAKAFGSNSGSAKAAIRCRLTAGGNFDENETTLHGGSAQSIALAVVHTTSVSRDVVLSCANVAPTNTEMRFVKIVATRVNAVSDVSM